jgi:hypothetical protein
MKVINHLSIIIFFILFLFSCKRVVIQKYPESNVWEAQLQDMLPKPMIRAIVTDSLEATIPIQLLDINKNKLAGASFIISRGDSSVYLKANGKGLVFITLNHSLITENPLIKIQFDTLKAKDIRYSIGGKTVVFKDGKSVNNEVVEYENLLYIEQGGFKLFYTTTKDTAIAYFPVFKNTLEKIKTIMGISSLSIVNPLLILGKDISVIGEPEGVLLLPINTNSWQEKFWYFTHETVENDLINQNNIYHKNPNLRFIGDGIAEYVSLKVLESINHEYALKMLNNRATSIANSNETDFSLYDWNTEDDSIEGYSYSLAFWMKIEKMYSHESIRSFIQKFKNLKSYNKQSIQQVFESEFGTGFSFNLSKQEAFQLLTINN